MWINIVGSSQGLWICSGGRIRISHFRIVYHIIQLFPNLATLVLAHFAALRIGI
jgi:hypothetical protein